MNRHFQRALAGWTAGAFAVIGLAGPVQGQARDPAAEAGDFGLMWIEADAKPTLAISWQDSTGHRHSHSVQLAYTEAEQRVRVADNLELYVSVGGTRLEAGAGHPRGAVVRIGVYKADKLMPMFGPIDPAEPIVIELDGVRFESPAVPRPESIVQHLSYAVDDVVACGLTKEYVNMYNLASEEDTLNRRAIGKRGRSGVIRTDTRDFEGAEVESRQVALARLGTRPDGTVSLWASLPYQLLRHRGDPSQLDLPGTFFEPYYFHLEFEAVPPDVAEREFGLVQDEVRFDADLD